MRIKLSNQIDQEVDSLIEELIGYSVPDSTEEVTSNTNETYQLPVQVGRNGGPISEDNKPWFVGYFSPGVATDHNHPQGHDGVDLKAPQGTPIYPIGSGVVVDSGVYPKGGVYVKVAHENGKVVSYYAHMLRSLVTVGQKVTKSTVIGLVGDTGNAKGRGAHLHFEIKVDGTKVNPLGVINKTVGSLSKQADRREVYLRFARRFV